MKFTLALTLFCASLVTTSCAKKADPVPATKLQLTVYNIYSSAYEQNATCELFASRDDFYNRTNVIQGTKTSDANGVIIYNNLQSSVYYFLVRSADGREDNLTHSGGPIQTNTSIETGKTTQIQVKIDY